ncbi:chemotaxis protein CheC [Tautonia rosea]|uniref:chemotaxis protein CheC n=1 Tax=Tautonia rosea TaxID=2728037 RepID=UPI0014744DAA|nr:chemotaxis protein CheC [Tautonia rosea]
MNSGDESLGQVPPRIDEAIQEGAEAASVALSKWLGRPASLVVSRVRFVELIEATEALGPGDAVVAACAIPLSGPLPGTVLMIFDDRSAMTMIDALLGRPEGTGTEWGEMEQSAAQETSNIVVCAFVNAMAESLNPGGLMIPGPPEFRFEFSGSLIEFALMDQMSRNDQIMMVEIHFSVDGITNDWAMVIVPAAGGLETLGLGDLGGEHPGEPS